MTKDYHIVVKDSGGNKRLSQSRFNFRKLSDLIPGIFKATGSGKNAKGVAKAVYDFNVHGGATGTIPLLAGDDLIPDNAIVTNVLIDVVAAVVGTGSSTVAITCQSAGDLLAATAEASLTIGLLDGVPDNTASKAIKLTGARNISAVIASGPLTAGQIVVFAEYVISE